MKIASYPTAYPTYYRNSYPNFGAKTPASLVSKFSHIENSGYHPFIQQAMKRLAEYKIEHGVIFTREGRLILETAGTKIPPYRPYKDIDKQEVIRLCKANPGHIYLHNHPNLDRLGQPKPITIADAWVTACQDASEGLVIHPDYTYSSVKCLPDENQFSCKSKSLLGQGYYLTRLDQVLVDLLNSSGRASDRLWRKDANEYGIIYTNTHDYTKMTV